MAKKKHLYEIDLMRTFIMMGVLAVHTVTVYQNQLKDFTPSYMTVGTIHTSMHFTRESFMFITGLVLFVTYYHKDFNPFKFWWKRLTLVAIPYLVWTVIDITSRHMMHHQMQFAPMMREIVHSLEVGNQFYLYYILVSIQFYIVFPLLLYIMRKLERWHAHIFVGSLVVEVGLMAFYEFVLRHMHTSQWPSFLAGLAAHRTTLVITYEFWFIAGAVLASHYPAIVAFVERYRKVLWWTLVAGIVVIWGYYWFKRLLLGQSDGEAETVEDPLYILYALVVTVSLWFAGVNWSRRRERPGWRFFTKFIQLGSDTSFGIYLFQTYPLMVLDYVIPHLQVPGWIFYCSIPFAVLFVYFSGMLVAFLIGKVPYLSYIVGRKVKFPRRARSPELSTSA